MGADEPSLALGYHEKLPDRFARAQRHGPSDRPLTAREALLPALRVGRLILGEAPAPASAREWCTPG